MIDNTTEAEMEKWADRYNSAQRNYEIERMIFVEGHEEHHTDRGQEESHSVGS